MFRSNHPEFPLLEPPRHECVFCPGALGELGGRVHRGVDFPTHVARDLLKGAEAFGVSGGDAKAFEIAAVVTVPEGLTSQFGFEGLSPSR